MVSGCGKKNRRKIFRLKATSHPLTLNAFYLLCLTYLYYNINNIILKDIYPLNNILRYLYPETIEAITKHIIAIIL